MNIENEIITVTITRADAWCLIDIIEKYKETLKGLPYSGEVGVSTCDRIADSVKYGRIISARNIDLPYERPSCIADQRKLGYRIMGGKYAESVAKAYSAINGKPFDVCSVQNDLYRAKTDIEFDVFYRAVGQVILGEISNTEAAAAVL